MPHTDRPPLPSRRGRAGRAGLAIAAAVLALGLGGTLWFRPGQDRDRIDPAHYQPPTAGQGNAAPADATVASGDGLVVGTWNLEWFFDEHTGDNFSDLARRQSAPDRESWNWRRDAVTASIAEAAPDILAVQEIEGQRVLYYLTSALERDHGMRYRSAFVEGTDYFTEQDVGFLMRDSLAMSRITRHDPPEGGASERFANVSKHAEAVYRVPAGEGVEEVVVMTVHLRAGEDAAEIRTRQASTVHAWLAERIARGENVILLGDLNSTVTGSAPPPGSDMAAILGHDTPAPEDDLVDLARYLPEDQRNTHLLGGRQYDRILVSAALLEDAPDRPDLVLESVQRRDDLAVRGRGVDSPGDHFDRYWRMPAEERDLSDHWPLMARFTIR